MMTTQVTVSAECPVAQAGLVGKTTTHVRIPSAKDYVPTAIVPNKTVAITPTEGCDNFRNAVYIPPAAVQPRASKEIANYDVSLEPTQGPCGTVVVSCPSDDQGQPITSNGSPASEKTIEKVERPTGSKLESDAGAAGPKPRWQDATREYSAVAIPVVQVRNDQNHAAGGSVQPRAKPSVLATLGGWARARPVVVFALALSIGGVMAVAAALILRAPQPSRKRIDGAVQVTTNVVPSKAAVLPTTEPAPAETIVILQPLELNAIEHLVAGRHSDALRTYEKLLERSPDNEVVRATVRILTARQAKECEPTAGGKPEGNRCPELLP
jgi:hypothetical protein